MLDTKIEGAAVVDGPAAPGFRADVGITGEAIAAVGDLSREPAGTVLRASGLMLAPGFIDVHSHSDWRLWANRRAESKVRQGVTTEVVGNCGFSPAPVNPSFREDLRGFALYLPEGMDFSWQSVEEYLRRFDQGGCALNLIQLVGHGTLRIAAMGFARRKPSDRELAHMQRLVAESLEGGAWGISTGLIYAPGSYAETDEIIELATVAGRPGGVYASHTRGRGAPALGQGQGRPGADRRRAGRGARRHRRRLSLYGLEHHAPHLAARMGPGGRRGGDAGAAPGPGGARPDPVGGRGGKAGGGRSGGERRLGRNHDRLRPRSPGG